MKRHNDLIRDILCYVEKKKNGDHENVLTLSVGSFAQSFSSATKNILDYHIEFLAERKLLKSESHLFGWFVFDLMWDGRDFLANTKD
jgi:hypothetical protein